MSARYAAHKNRTHDDHQESSALNSANGAFAYEESGIKTIYDPQTATAGRSAGTRTVPQDRASRSATDYSDWIRPILEVDDADIIESSDDEDDLIEVTRDENPAATTPTQAAAHHAARAQAATPSVEPRGLGEYRSEPFRRVVPPPRRQRETPRTSWPSRASVPAPRSPSTPPPASMRSTNPRILAPSSPRASSRSSLPPPPFQLGRTAPPLRLPSVPPPPPARLPVNPSGSLRPPVASSTLAPRPVPIPSVLRARTRSNRAALAFLAGIILGGVAWEGLDFIRRVAAAQPGTGSVITTQSPSTTLWSPVSRLW